MLTEQGIAPADFRRIASVLRHRVGIELAETKQSLLLARLGSLMRTGQYLTWSALADALEEAPDGPLLVELVNRLSTNHTFFNREERHFTFLRDEVIPRWIREVERGERTTVRAWSAACSTGEEPYTLAMVLADHRELANRWRILATDVASRAVETATAGVYPAASLEKLPEGWRRRYCAPHPAGGIIAADLRRNVVFRRMNLIRPVYPFKGSFDLVLCRNVLIYFSEATRREVISRIVGHIVPGGYFITGHSETVDRSSLPVEYLSPGIYRRVPS